MDGEQDVVLHRSRELSPQEAFSFKSHLVSHLATKSIGPSISIQAVNHGLVHISDNLC